MTSVWGYPLAHVALCLALLAAAVLWDVRERRIPNSVNAVLLVSGLAAQLIAHGWRQALLGLAAAGIMLLVLWLPWMLGGFGGGDVKLAAAVSAWLGLERLIPFALSAALAGGVVAVVAYLLSRRVRREQVRHNLLAAVLLRAWPRLSRGDVPMRETVPYAIAITAGAVFALSTEVWP